MHSLKEYPRTTKAWYTLTSRYMVGIAQLVRVLGCGPGGRRFESDYPPQKSWYTPSLIRFGVFSSGFHLAGYPCLNQSYVGL